MAAQPGEAPPEAEQAHGTGELCGATREDVRLMKGASHGPCR